MARRSPSSIPNLPQPSPPASQELRGRPHRIRTRPRTGIEAIADSDVVFVSQGVPLDRPPVAEARARGIPLDSMTRCFLEHCPGPTIGITGSSGKTTTTSLVARDHGRRRPRPTASAATSAPACSALLDGMDERTWAVLEISHTQLQLTDRSPHIAAVLNVTPNHLDQFTWDEYVALKQQARAVPDAGRLSSCSTSTTTSRPR